MTRWRSLSTRSRARCRSELRSDAQGGASCHVLVDSGSSRVLDVLIEPRHFFPEDVFDGLLAAIAVGFEGEEEQARSCAVAADGLVHAVALYWEGAVVVVGFTVDQQHGRFYLVGIHEGRHLEVDIRCLPDGAALAL